MSSETVKNEVITQIKAQYAMNNMRELIEKINEHCFAKCVPKPSTSLSSGEQTCFTQCMDKYMAAWDKVSHAYISQLKREGP